LTPLVSCIMPTRDRRQFVAQAVAYFHRQDYPHKELVVVDDGGDAVADLIPRPPLGSYLRLERPHSIGVKRNMAISAAHGQIVVHWDDDDWYGERRIGHQVAPLLDGRAAVSGLKTGYMLDLAKFSFWACRDDLHARLFYANLHGGTIAYARDVWERLARFPDSSLAEDAAFLKATAGRAPIVALPNDDDFVYVRHGWNAWEFVCGHAVDASAWSEVSPPASFAPDEAFYRALAASLAADSTSLKRQGDALRRNGAPQQALEYYERALERDPLNVWAWFDKGLSLELLGRHDEALGAVLHADRLLHPLDGNRTWLHAELGVLYARLGRRDLARYQFERALLLYRSNDIARRGLASLRG
jgi:glycosyl transferase family 2/tetratricopeptide repeat protein